MEWLKKCLASEFKIRDLGSLRYFHGMEEAQSNIGIIISWRKCAVDLLNKIGMSYCHPAETPISPYLNLWKRKVIQSYIMVPIVGWKANLLVTHMTWYCICSVSQFMHSPHEKKLDVVYWILRYLRSLLGKGLFFKKNEHWSIEAYIDADWASSFTDRKSASIYYTFCVKELSDMEKQEIKCGCSAPEYRSMAPRAGR